MVVSICYSPDAIGKKSSDYEMIGLSVQPDSQRKIGGGVQADILECLSAHKVDQLIGSSLSG